ncbi:FadR/GntR family transcriptional regulator [Microlunatus ginsengisoli]|uniref:FadR/GntR family transcriptional regulator n=1 Tax=Microlunatus ginsengisoli TaxID=363863 RepID=A0ABP7A4S9_9ACTN
MLDDLQDAIAAGVIRVGDRLPSEAALAARYSVSRSVIREVLRASSALGLTVTRTGKGTFVVGRRPSELIFGGYSVGDLLEVRPHIEVPAAGLAALRRTEADLEQIQGLIEHMEAESDPQVWIGLDASFHLAVAEASKNPVFTQVINSIRAALTGQSGMLNDRSRRRRGDSDSEHRSIAAAIARSSVVEAEDAMRFHLDQVHDAVAESLTDDTARPGQRDGPVSAIS